MKRVIFFSVIAATLSLAGSMAWASQLTQISTIDALLCGIYDGTTTIGELLQSGSFGIGTLNGLDGELVIWDDHAYQVSTDGHIYEVHPATKTPFANITDFQADAFTVIDAACFDDVRTALNHWLPSPNLFYAIHMYGTFPYMRTRSVPRQSPPYPPLADVVKKQTVFEMNDVSGHVVGFYCPPYVKGVNVPGFHLHFLSDDKQFGGHILDFSTAAQRVERMDIHDFRMLLPQGSAFFTTDLSKDRSQELRKVEGQ
ncbi:MAG: acetolactate decarboxylase [Spartobacteria bacterium]|nr:acetolactate decarboxylase [Spartobacteria bacterium]